MNFSDIVKLVRAEMCYSQADLAKELAVTEQMLEGGNTVVLCLNMQLKESCMLFVKRTRSRYRKVITRCLIKTNKKRDCPCFFSNG